MMKITPSPRRRSVLRLPLTPLGIGLLSVVFVCGHPGAQERLRQASASAPPEVRSDVGKVYKSKGPLGVVSRELYVPFPKPNVSSVISCGYVGPSGLGRFERLTYQVLDDVYQDPEVRYSDDNGKTWTPWQDDPAGNIVKGKNLYWQWNANGIAASCHAPESKRLIQVSMLRGFEGGDPRVVGLHKLHDFVFYSLSKDGGRTWAARKQLKYEDGPQYSEDARETPEFLAKNTCWFYYNIVVPRSGGIVFPISQYATHTDDDGTTSTVGGCRCFIGRWNQGREDFEWSVSQPLTASKKLTGYLEEPWVAELANGDLLLDMRGTNADIPDVPGRHWYSLSRDGGRTWTDPADWRYDDGRQFDSPAAMAKMLRHSKTGKLYWFGNISRGATAGNSPRYPMYIAEIDETKPALRRASLTVIDDYDPARHTPQVQFSNFFVFENRETHAFEVYLSPYGQYRNVYQASVYKYVIQLE
jgi:hypothetical protein